MILNRTIRLLVPVFIVTALSACNENELFKSSVGNYQGFAYVNDSNGSSRQMGILSKVHMPGDGMLNVEIVTSGGNPFATIQLTIVQDKIIMSEIVPNALKVILSHSSDTCFADTNQGPQAGHGVCFDGREVRIFLGATMSLSMTSMNTWPLPQLEKPSTFTVSQIVDRALHQGFASKVEYDRVLKAQYQARNYYLSLLPHFNTGTVINVLAAFPAGILNPVNLAKAAGDLVPFLMPDRWARADEQHDNSIAEEDAWLVMQADTANLAEGLAYSTLRDQRAVLLLEQSKRSVDQIRQEIIQRESGGLAQAGAHGPLDASINSLDDSIRILKSNNSSESSMLAASAGFYNPAAVTSVTPTIESSFEKQPAKDDPKMINFVLNRAVETRQLDWLIHGAETEVVARCFDFLDTNGDDHGSMGFSYFSYINIGQADVSQMKDYKNQVTDNLIQRLSEALDDSNSAIEGFQNAQDGSAIQDRIIFGILQNMRSNLDVNIQDLATAFEKKIANQIQQINMEAFYYISLGKIQRYTLSGRYKDILPKVK